jgi:hypothetical protein
MATRLTDLYICVLVMITSPWWWPECRPKHVGSRILWIRYNINTEVRLLGIFIFWNWLMHGRWNKLKLFFCVYWLLLSVAGTVHHLMTGQWTVNENNMEQSGLDLIWASVLVFVLANRGKQQRTLFKTASYGWTFEPLIAAYSVAILNNKTDCLFNDTISASWEYIASNEVGCGEMIELLAGGHFQDVHSQFQSTVCFFLYTEEIAGNLNHDSCYPSWYSNCVHPQPCVCVCYHYNLFA